MAITREQIIWAMRDALEPLEHVNAMWLAGSAATGSLDELSDIDAVLDVADGTHGHAFAVVEAALEALAPIAHRLELPEPTWHGHSQRLYRLGGCPEHLLIDLCVMQRGSAGARFAEREIHGQPVVLFDKLGVVCTVSVDRAVHREKMRAHLSTLRSRFALLGHMPGKEVVRGNELDALWRYHSFVLTPLISVLRARYSPLFHDFAPRYLKSHLPADVYERLMRLSYVADFSDLEARLAEALAWAEDELAAIDIDAIEL